MEEAAEKLAARVRIDLLSSMFRRKSSENPPSVLDHRAEAVNVTVQTPGGYRIVPLQIKISASADVDFCANWKPL